jgi:transcriptional regulator with XRE-family HTH domain
MTQAELGELLFCSYSQISHYEAAFRRPLPDVAERLDEVFNTDGGFGRLYGYRAPGCGPRWAPWCSPYSCRRA